MPRARRPLGVLGAAPPAISHREPSRGVLGAASSAVATPRVAPGPAHAGSRVAPAHRGASKAASAGMASRLCLETGRRKAASTPRKAWLQWGDFFEAPLGKKLGGRYA